MTSGKTISPQAPFFANIPATTTLLVQQDSFREYERDAMAEKIMRMPEENFLQRKCAHCEEKEKKLQRKPLASFIQRKGSAGGNVASDSVSDQINATKGNGNSLDVSTRSFMESRFGSDFSDVKIHTNEDAVQLNRELNAKAFTVGNDIYFNNGHYQPGTDFGKHLLAHELTHTLQQNKQSDYTASTKILRSCNLDLSEYAQQNCTGSIQVGATTISMPIAGYYHLFILYTDNEGRRFYFRGGPSPTAGGGYGNIVVTCDRYVRGQNEYDPANLIEDVYHGTDACTKLNIIKTTLNQIERWNIPYVPAGPNSNSVIATLLHASGLPLRKPAVPTPGFEMEITNTGGRPLQQESPTTLVGGLGFGNGLLLNAELQHRLYTLSPTIGNIPIPIPLILQAGIYGMPDQGRLGGSLGLGTDLSLFNLPLPRHSPLGVQLGVGGTAGVAGIGDSGGSDTEVGAYFRAGIYTDISRFRIGAAYQYNYLHNLANASDADLHSFLVQVGYTFGN